MDKGVEGIRPESNSTSRELATQAKDMFVRASLTNPASAIGQAARIAKRCKILQLDPSLLRDSLLTQTDLIAEICVVGDSRHKKSGVRRAKSLTPKDVAMVVSADFTMAEKLISLSDEELREIYNYSKGMAPLDSDEEELAAMATAWLEDLGIEFVYGGAEQKEDFGDSR